MPYLQQCSNLVFSEGVKNARVRLPYLVIRKRESSVTHSKLLQYKKNNKNDFCLWHPLNENNDGSRKLTVLASSVTRIGVIV